jgi:hypothetical protein
MASKALHAAWRRSTSCGVGWICRETNAPVMVITLASFLCTLLPHACLGMYIRQTWLHRTEARAREKPGRSVEGELKGARLDD